MHFRHQRIIATGVEERLPVACLGVVQVVLAPCHVRKHSVEVEHDRSTERLHTTPSPVDRYVRAVRRGRHGHSSDGATDARCRISATTEGSASVVVSPEHAALGHVAQQPAHDLSRTGLGQIGVNR